MNKEVITSQFELFRTRKSIQFPFKFREKYQMSAPKDFPKFTFMLTSAHKNSQEFIIKKQSKFYYHLDDRKKQILPIRLFSLHMNGIKEIQFSEWSVSGFETTFDDVFTQLHICRYSNEFFVDNLFNIPYYLFYSRIANNDLLL